MLKVSAVLLNVDVLESTNDSSKELGQGPRKRTAHRQTRGITWLFNSEELQSATFGGTGTRLVNRAPFLPQWSHQCLLKEEVAPLCAYLLFELRLFVSGRGGVFRNVFRAPH